MRGFGSPSPARVAHVSMLLVVAGLALAAPGAPARAVERKSHFDMARDAVDRHIVPRLETLVRATRANTAAAEAFCAEKPAKNSLARFEASFREVVLAWGAVQFLRFGPLREQNRLERFFFWPDPRGVTDRQVRALLAARKPALLAPGGLVGQSVAVQGLGALEIVLADARSWPLGPRDEGAAYACAYARAVSANLETLAGETLAGWTAPDGWRHRMMTPGSDNATYHDAAETAREVVKTFLLGAQALQNTEIEPRLAAATATDGRKPPRLPFDRSGLSVAYLGAGIASLDALYAEIGLAAYAPPDKLWMATFVPQAFKTLAADVRALGKIKGRALKTPADVSLLRRLRFNLNGMRQIVIRELAPAAEVVLGFNELDGD